MPGYEAANDTAENPISEIVKANEDQQESDQVTEKETVESVVDNAKNELSPVENIVDNDDIEKDNVDDENVKDVKSEVQEENKEENKTVDASDENVENSDSANKDESPLQEQEQETTNTNNINQSGNLEPVSPVNEGLSPEREEDYQDDDDDDGEVKDEELGPRYSPKAPVITIQPVNIVYFIKYPFFLLFSSFELHERGRIRSAYWLKRKKGIRVA